THGPHGDEKRHVPSLTWKGGALGVVTGEPLDGHTGDPHEVEDDGRAVRRGGDDDAGEEVADARGRPDDGGREDQGGDDGDAGEDGAVPVAGWYGHVDGDRFGDHAGLAVDGVGDVVGPLDLAGLHEGSLLREEGRAAAGESGA